MSTIAKIKGHYYTVAETLKLGLSVSTTGIESIREKGHITPVTLLGKPLYQINDESVKRALLDKGIEVYDMMHRLDKFEKVDSSTYPAYLKHGVKGSQLCSFAESDLEFVKLRSVVLLTRRKLLSQFPHFRLCGTYYIALDCIDPTVETPMVLYRA